MEPADYPGMQADDTADHRELRAFGGHHALIVGEVREQFGSWLGSGDGFHLNAAAGTAQVGKKTFKVQILGTHSYASDTWVWSWASPAYDNDKSRHLTTAARWLRMDAVERQWAWQVRTPLFSLNEYLLEGGMECWSLLNACFAWLRSRACGTFQFAQGRTYFVVQEGNVPPARPDPVTLPRILNDACELTGMPARDLLITYYHWYQLPLTQTEAGLHMTYPGGSYVDIELDGHGRALNITGQAHPSDIYDPPKAR